MLKLFLPNGVKGEYPIDDELLQLSPGDQFPFKVSLFVPNWTCDSLIDINYEIISIVGSDEDMLYTYILR